MKHLFFIFLVIALNCFGGNEGYQIQTTRASTNYGSSSPLVPINNQEYPSREVVEIELGSTQQSLEGNNFENLQLPKGCFFTTSLGLGLLGFLTSLFVLAYTSGC